MTPVDRKVRAEVYRYFLEAAEEVTARSVATTLRMSESEVADSFLRLQSDHMLAVDLAGRRVHIANPFSGVPTPYVTVINDRKWFANCAWDGLAILSLLGDGEVRQLESDWVWRVSDGAVEPEGYIHLLVPAKQFWDDIRFT
jgi:hypothetical protein